MPNLMILRHTGSFPLFLWLIFIFDNFMHSCCKFWSSVIVQKWVVTIHKTCIYFLTRYTRDIVVRHSYQTPPSLSVSHNILLEKNLKPYFPATCAWHSMFTWFTTSFPFSYFSHIYLPAGGCSTSSLIHILECPVSKPEKLETLDCAKAFFLTTHNNVTHLTVIKMEAVPFWKKVGHPGCRVLLPVPCEQVLCFLLDFLVDRTLIFTLMWANMVDQWFNIPLSLT